MPLSEWEAAGAGDGSVSARVLLAMADPSNLELTPGWPLRNALLLAAARWRAARLSVLCVRDARGRADCGRSFVVDVALPELPAGWPEDAPEAFSGFEPNAARMTAPRCATRVWELLLQDTQGMHWRMSCCRLGSLARLP